MPPARTRSPADPDRPGRAAGPARAFSVDGPIRATARAVEELSVRVATDPDVGAEVLHRFHQRLRKLRMSLRVVRELVPSEERPFATEVLRRVGRLSRLVGDVRDLDVGLSLVPALGARPRHHVDGPDPLATVRHRFAEKARTGRSLLGAFVRADTDQGLFRDPDRLLEAAGGRLGGPGAARKVDRLLARTVRRSERARRRAVRRSDPERAHDLRIALRRVRLLSDLRAAGAGREPAHFPARLREVQAALGALHDLDRLAEHLEELGEQKGPFARAEEERRRELEREIRGRIRKRSFRAALARLAG